MTQDDELFAGDRAEADAGQSTPRDDAGQPPRRDDAPRPSASRGRHARRPRPPAASRPRTSPVVSARPAGAAARRRGSSGGRAAIALVAVAAIAAAAVFGVWWTLYRAEASVPAGRGVTIVVPQGASSSEVASLLASKGVVANALMFKLRAEEMGALDELKPGTYSFKTGASYTSVIRVLATGPTIVYATVTIPEGWTIQQIADRLQAECGIPVATFTKLATTGRARFQPQFAFLSGDPLPTLQGYLFPKTYQVKKGSTASDVIEMMLTQYGEETASLDLSYAMSKNLTLHDVTTIASIIEHEVYVPKDRATVASVIYNRLHLHMMLQLDSTVQYALGGKAELSLSDLQNPSPYNTYQHFGLPPGPIDNPGLASLQAAAHPSHTGYLYYILTHKDGSQSFTSSYTVFLQLKAQAAKGLK